MAQPGPKPKPTKIKELQGGSSTSHRPMPENEPQPEVPMLTPNPPENLKKVGRAEWIRTSEELHKVGLLTNLDLAALTAYCFCFETFIDATEKVKEHGVIIKAQSGFPMQSPYLTIANKAMSEMRRWLVEFGMTPSSRTRVKGIPIVNDDPTDEF